MGKKGIQSARSAWSIWYSELKVHVLPSIEGNNKGSQRNTHARANTDTPPLIHVLRGSV